MMDLSLNSKSPNHTIHRIPKPQAVVARSSNTGCLAEIAMAFRDSRVTRSGKDPTTPNATKHDQTLRV